MFKGVKSKAFTLVELIVVITILAILGTIAFMAFQGYSKDARDSIRASDIALIQKSLETYKIPVGKYPIPTDTADIVYSGAVAWTQGTVGDSVVQNVANLNKIPLDPLIGTEYAYSVTSDYKEFEVGGIVEGDVVYNTPFIKSAHANANIRAYIKGTYNGKTLRARSGSIDYILAVPTIIATDKIPGWSLLDLINNFKLAFNGYNNVPATYKGSGLGVESGGFNFTPGKIVVFSGAIEDLSSTGAQVEFIQNLQIAYDGTILENEDTYYEIANISIDPVTPSDETLALAAININTTTGLDLPVPEYESSIIPLGGTTGNALLDELNTITGQNLTEAEWLDVTNLNLSFKNLTSIPGGVFLLTSLESLDLSSNLLTELPAEIGNLTTLTYLKVRGTNEREITIPAEIGNLTNLSFLDISGNLISTLPIEIANLVNLTTLNLLFNTGLGYLSASFNPSSSDLYQDDIPTAGQRMTIGGNGTTIDITVGAIPAPPPEGLTQAEVDELNSYTGYGYSIAQRLSLTSLTIRGKTFYNLPSGISDLVNLRILDLSFNGSLTKLPSDFGNLTSLTSLNLSGTRLLALATLFSPSSLPRAQTNVTVDGGDVTIGGNGSTIYITVTGTAPINGVCGSDNGLDLTSTPVNLCSAGTASSVTDSGVGSTYDWTCNGINGGTTMGCFANHVDASAGLIQAEVDQLNSLTSQNLSISEWLAFSGTLDLSGKNLSEVPTGVYDLVNLTGLYLYDNNLTSISVEIGNLTSILDLRLGWNSLTALPAELWTITSLNTLYINNNLLTSIPSSISNLTNLTTFSPGSNSGLTLPAELWTMTNLTGLYLHYIGLTTVPTSIGNLTNLTFLGLAGNTLLTLPSELFTLTSLTTLGLDSIGLTSLPSGIGNLVNLTELHLISNNLTQLPSEIGNLNNLTLLRFSPNTGLGNLSFDFNTSSSIRTQDNITPEGYAISISGNGATIDIVVDTTPINGVCGSDNGLDLYSIPTNLCNAGTASTVVDNGTGSTYTWTCNGINGGTTANCSANHLEHPLTDAEIIELNTLTGNSYTRVEWLAQTSLSIQGKGLTSIPTGVYDLNISSLTLYGNALTTISVEVFNLTNLTSLNLGNNGLTSLPIEIGNLTNLTSLSLGDNSLTSIPSSIGNLINLSGLYLQNNGLTSLPIEIGNLTSLYNLWLNNNNLTNIPAEIGNLTNLGQLLLGNNSLTSLPIEIGNLISLTNLQLYNNNLNTLPSELWSLTSLTSLYLGNNSLTSLPIEIGNLTNLTTLSLDNLIGLTSIPTEIGNLINLTTLSIWGVGLTSLPIEIFNLTNLTTLNLTGNSLTSIPSSIGNLTNLTRLYIGDNLLTSLPAELWTLTGITNLWLHENQLTTIPAGVGNLSLGELTLMQNNLTNLPAEIGNLTGITHLRFYENEIMSPLPTEVCTLIANKGWTSPSTNSDSYNYSDNPQYNSGGTLETYVFCQ